MDAREYLIELDKALGEYRYQDIRGLTDSLDPTAVAPGEVKKALSLMRRKRQFGEMEHAANLFTQAGHAEPVLLRQRAQALLDLDRVNDGLKVLKQIDKKYGDHATEGPEIRGLIGRAYKQRYVNKGGEDNLRKAIQAYWEDWSRRRGDYRWQGINVAALVARAKRDGVPSPVEANPAAIAQLLLDDIDDNGPQGVWDYATALEASVALEDQPRALAYAKDYLRHPGADAFEIGSTLRQLKEVWQLEGKSLGNAVLPVLEYALMQKEGASVEPLSTNLSKANAGFEAVWGNEGVIYLQWLDTMYSRCNAIARVFDTNTGAPQGTGFLVKGSLLKPAWGDSPVFVTNAHVISRDPVDQAALMPEEASAEFTRLPGRPKVVLGELLFSSPKHTLDVSILRVDVPPGSTLIDPYPYLPSTNSADEQRIYVIGHPLGNEMAVSLYDNSLAGYQDQYVRYRSPTEGGNSGSPVFTKKLNAIALHHRALEDLKLNEGVLLNVIKEALA